MRKEWSGSGTPESPVSGAKRRKCAQIFKNLRNVKLLSQNNRVVEKAHLTALPADCIL
jgi:hypothetical protein